MLTETQSNSIKLLLLLSLPIVLYTIPEESIYNGKSICLYTNIFGVECWGCGITRAIFSALYLRFTEAWEYNRLVTIVFPLLVFEWIKSVVRLTQHIIKKR